MNTDDRTEAANADTAPPESLPQLSPFIATHCMTCAAGWTRHGQNGGVVVVCLLDRARVWPEMLDCDRYEPREGAEDATAAPEVSA